MSPNEPSGREARGPEQDPRSPTEVRQGRIVKGGVMVRTIVVSLALLVVCFIAIILIF